MEATERRWERLARFGLLLSAGLLVASVPLPYWQVRVVAPQYPQGLRLTAYLNRLRAMCENWTSSTTTSA